MDGPLGPLVPVTTKVAVAKSPAGLPVRVIVYEPAGTLATGNEPAGEPPETMQLDGTPTAPPDTEQVVSVTEKFAPEKSTVAPTAADDGLSVIDGIGIVVAVDEVSVVCEEVVDVEFAL